MPGSQAAERETWRLRGYGCRCRLPLHLVAGVFHSGGFSISRFEFPVSYAFSETASVRCTVSGLVSGWRRRLADIAETR